MTEDEEIIDLASIMSLSRRMDEHYTKLEAEEHVKELLKEMAHERKYFKALITNMAQQIIENWCLINYATLNGHLISYKKHWQSELIACMGNAAGTKIKGNDSFESRKKAIAEVWDAEDFSNDTNVIDLRIFGKFEKENLDTNCPIYQQVLQNCLNASANIIEVIAKGNKDLVKQYVYGL